MSKEVAAEILRKILRDDYTRGNRSRLVVLKYMIENRAPQTLADIRKGARVNIYDTVNPMLAALQPHLHIDASGRRRRYVLKEDISTIDVVEALDEAIRDGRCGSLTRTHALSAIGLKSTEAMIVDLLWNDRELNASEISLAIMHCYTNVLTTLRRMISAGWLRKVGTKYRLSEDAKSRVEELMKNVTA
ncbi:MAG: hypothetical protein QHG98_07240 [Methanothrix sp.]|nr:hypothetical protein [Methanothrix sp.]